MGKKDKSADEVCTFSGANLVGYVVDKHEDTPEMVLDVEQIKERFKQYRLYKRGYQGLFKFLFFAMWYMIVLAQQDHEPATGQANTGIKDVFNKAKSDLKVFDSVTAWKWMGGKIVPMITGVPWSGTRDDTEHHDTSEGREAFGYFYNVGGLAITAKKSQQHKCFRGQMCYSEEPLTDDFFELTLPGGKIFKVPYNEKLEGYTVGVPTSTTPANVAELLAGYAGLFGPDTREIQLDAILFNPNGQKTISSVRATSSVSVHNQVAIILTLNTIPYHLYDNDPQTANMQILSQILLIVFLFYVLARPLVVAMFFEPKFHQSNFSASNDGSNNKEIYENALLRLTWLDHWRHLPTGRDGELMWKAPAALMSSVFLAVLYWIYIVGCYQQIGAFGADEYDNLYQDPLANYATADLDHKMNIALQDLWERGFPLMEQERDIANSFSNYFMLQTLVVALIMVRFLQYLSFQKRLSMVTDTFSDISYEFMHIFFVLSAICFTLGVTYSLACGSLDPAFRRFGPSYWNMIETMFGMFKPAGATAINPPPQKYTPNTVIGNEYINWVPVVILLLFKILVTLLLFKLLMGVIMTSYKKSAKLKKGARPITAELKELWTITKYYYIQHKLRKEPYVRFEHLVIALSNKSSSPDQPWRERFVGFGNGPEAVKDLLNSIVKDKDDFSRPRLKAVVDHHRLVKCDTTADALFCMRLFGKNRDIAKYEFRDWLLKTETEKYAKQLEKAQKADEDADMKTKAKQHAHIVLNDIARRLAQKEHKGDMMQDFKKEKIEKEEVDLVFHWYDFYLTGQLDIRFLKPCLASLGYNLPDSVVRHLVKEYDSDENHCLDQSEFHQLLKDRTLLGRRESQGVTARQRKSQALPGTMQFALAAKVMEITKKRPPPVENDLLTVPLLDGDTDT